MHKGARRLSQVNSLHTASVKRYSESDDALTPNALAVRAAVWNWKQDSETHSTVRNKRALRIRGALQFLVGSIVATVLAWIGFLLWAGIVIGITATIFVLSMVSPTYSYSGIDKLFNLLGRGIGQLMSYVLLVPVYVLVMTPLGFVLRHKSSDRLGTRLMADNTTYWESTETRKTDYERQF